MDGIGRRSFLALTASALTAHARALQTVGVQLYTVRDILPKKPLETLQAIEQIGYREVEVTAQNLDAIWPAYNRRHLKRSVRTSIRNSSCASKLSYRRR